MQIGTTECRTMRNRNQHAPHRHFAGRWGPAIFLLCCAASVHADAQTETGSENSGFATLNAGLIDPAAPKEQKSSAEQADRNITADPSANMPAATDERLPDVASMILKSPAPLPETLNAQFSETDFHTQGQFDFNHFPPGFSFRSRDSKRPSRYKNRGVCQSRFDPGLRSD